MRCVLRGLPALTAVIASGALFIPLSPPGRGGQEEGREIKALDAAVRHAVKSWDVPGAAVVVVRDGRVIYLQGHGVRELGKPAAVTPDTVFALSSCTKALTSALIARLAEEGVLRWDDPVRDHLPWFRLDDALVEREVTIRDLMCHRTGLAAHELLWRHAPWGPEEAVRRAGRVPLAQGFRTRLQYQSTMAAAAGLAAGAAGKSTWEDLLRRKLLTPLGMTATYLSTAEAEKSGQLAAGHALDRAGATAAVPAYRFAQPDPACGAYSSARDLGKWLQFHLAGGAVAGKAVVSPRRLAETYEPQIVNPLSPAQLGLWPTTAQFGYALGWVVYDYGGHRVVSHGGAIDGFRAHVVLVPEAKIGLAILVNMNQTSLPVPLANALLDQLLGLRKRDWHALHRAFLARLAKDAATARAERLARRRLGTRPTRELGAYVGTYDHPAYGSVKVALRRGGLVWQWRGEEAVMEHFHSNTFTAAGEVLGQAELTFTLDEKGDVNELAVTGDVNQTFIKAPRRKGP